MYIFRGFSFGTRSTRTVEGNVSLEGDLSEIIVEADISEVKIRTGSEFSVAYSVPEALEPKVSLKNGTLEVSSLSSMNLSFGNMNFDNYIIITIPEDSELARVSVDVDAGDIDLSELNVSKLQVTVDAGNMDLKKISATRIEIDADAGNVELRDCNTDSLKIDVDAGNVDLYDSTIGTINAEVDAGNIESHNCKIDSGTVDADLGNIDLGGEIGDVSAHASLGNTHVDKNKKTA